MSLTRREFHEGLLGSLLTWSLLDTICGSEALAAPVRMATSEWLKRVNGLAQDLRGEKLSQVEWQNTCEELFSQVDLPQLLKAIDFEKLTSEAKLADRGASHLKLSLDKVEGVPEKLVFGRQIFGLKEGRSVIPHGHDNMTSAFLILGGSFRGRHFDRIETQDEHFLIKPTIDKTFESGGCSTVSDDRDNVHWFEALEEGSYILNIHVLGLVPGVPATGRVYLDPQGEQLADGLIRARKIGYAECNKLYG